MKKLLIFIALLCTKLGATLLITSENDFLPYMDRQDVIVIASTGRSGSSLLTENMEKYAPDRTILKTHQFIPKGFKGKVLFIFSNPDLTAESLLHMVFDNNTWGELHFKHVFSSDKKWAERLKWKFNRQTIKNNLLSYDALGIGIHLEKWLLTGVEPAPHAEAQILAIKYENLWDLDTQQALVEFCSLSEWVLPKKEKRGYQGRLKKNELLFRTVYNQGNLENPRYAAYNFARELWETAAPLQFLRLKE